MAKQLSTTGWIRSRGIRSCGMSLAMLIGWGMSSLSTAAFQIALPPETVSVASQLRAQGLSAEESSQHSVLTFRADKATETLTQVQVNLNRTIVPLPAENTTLGGEVFGAAIIDGGDRQRMDTYQWLIAPSSKLYLGRSGYKSVLARYQYGKTKQSLQYTLDIACQTVGLKTQNKAVCSFFGNGPLLTGELKTKGKLTFEEAMVADADSTAPLQSSPSAQAANEYQGRGTLVMFPIDAKALEERYSLTRITVGEAKDSTRLSLTATEPKAKTLVFQGKLEPTEGGKTLTINTIDGIPAQGKVFMGKNGLLRTTTPIFMGADDRELTVYFRPN